MQHLTNIIVANLRGYGLRCRTLEHYPDVYIIPAFIRDLGYIAFINSITLLPCTDSRHDAQIIYTDQNLAFATLYTQK